MAWLKLDPLISDAHAFGWGSHVVHLDGSHAQVGALCWQPALVQRAHRGQEQARGASCRERVRIRVARFAADVNSLQQNTSEQQRAALSQSVGQSFDCTWLSQWVSVLVREITSPRSREGGELLEAACRSPAGDFPSPTRPRPGLKWRWPATDSTSRGDSDWLEAPTSTSRSPCKGYARRRPWPSSCMLLLTSPILFPKRAGLLHTAGRYYETHSFF